MALQNAVQGDRHTGQTITWYAGNNPKNLSGSVITGRIYDPNTRTSVAITGSLALTDAVNGVFQWLYSAADTQNVGDFTVQFTATYNSDSFPDSSFEEGWRVLPKR